MQNVRRPNVPLKSIDGQPDGIRSSAMTISRGKNYQMSKRMFKVRDNLEYVGPFCVWVCALASGLFGVWVRALAAGLFGDWVRPLAAGLLATGSARKRYSEKYISLGFARKFNFEL